MDVNRLGRASGAASVVLAFGGTLLAMGLSPSFTWTEHALSDLGVAWTDAGTTATVLLFDGGLVLGGLAGLAFARCLVWTGVDRLDRLAGGAFGVTSASMGAVGLFPLGTTLHVPVAVAFFLGISITAALAGAGALRRGVTGYGAASLALAVANLGAWLAWALAGGTAVVGLAVPELWGSLVLATWVLLTVRRWPPAP